MQELWRWGNLSLAFVMELAALAALALWGWKVADATAIKVVSAIGAPLIAAVLWGLFAAPQAAFDIPVLAIVTKAVVFASAAAALWNIGYSVTAVVFVVVVAANLMIIRIGQLAVPA
ncbi:YrdB family protein [Nocardia sp. NPDC052254]|uniref:YrdB family protein n=1 Tax=Nocardia sp. NPDC052254 TaxID=3155681 RepID=UPI00343A2C1C